MAPVFEQIQSNEPQSCTLSRNDLEAVPFGAQQQPDVDLEVAYSNLPQVLHLDKHPDDGAASAPAPRACSTSTARATSRTPSSRRAWVRGRQARCWRGGSCYSRGTPTTSRTSATTDLGRARKLMKTYGLDLRKIASNGWLLEEELDNRFLRKCI